MIKGYRDVESNDAHVVLYDAADRSVVRLEFGDDGLLRSPTPAQVAAMTSSEQRRARFVAVEDDTPAEAPTKSKKSDKAETKEG